jgi:hypothetical protein
MKQVWKSVDEIDTDIKAASSGRYRPSLAASKDTINPNYYFGRIRAEYKLLLFDFFQSCSLALQSAQIIKLGATNFG